MFHAEGFADSCAAANSKVQQEAHSSSDFVQSWISMFKSKSCMMAFGWPFMYILTKCVELVSDSFDKVETLKCPWQPL